MKTIYSISKTGKVLEWNAHLRQDLNPNGHLEIVITSGQQGGKKVSKIRLVKSGKNIGKVNETSIEKQAEDELERLYTKQYDKGYVDKIENISPTKQVGEIKKPQLAAKYPNKAHKLGLPEDTGTQPKIDGVRCFITQTNEGLKFTSRTGKPIPNVPRIELEIGDKLPLRHIMDGELYIEGLELQEIISVVLPTKNKKEEQLGSVCLKWYDYIPFEGEHLEYNERFINNKLEFDSSIIEKLKVDNFSPDTLEDTFDRYIAEGYEGLMLRDLKAGYKFGSRVDSLQKYKKMHTDEFQIIDIVESDQDFAPRFLCDLRNGNTVTVRLVGDKGENMEYLTNKEKYIGEWLTIKYQTWTKTGSLQFPVGEMIREGRVIDGLFIPSI